MQGKVRQEMDTFKGMEIKNLKDHRQELILNGSSALTVHKIP